MGLWMLMEENPFQQLTDSNQLADGVEWVQYHVCQFLKFKEMFIKVR